MSVATGKGPLVDPGLCRCCGATKKCRLLNAEYTFLGQKEVYSDMLVDCFGLMLSNLDGDEHARLICATCVLRLRDARAFRSQVLYCEQKLLHDSIKVHDGDRVAEMKIELPSIKTESEENMVTSTKTDTKNDVDEELEQDVGGDDYVDDDSESLNIESKKRLKKKKKVKAKTEKKRAKVLSNDIANKKIRRIRKERKEIVVEYDQYTSKKRIDTEHKSFTNAITIVENSYVCPFDTSFSDYYCIYCREVFTDPTKLREHTLTHGPTAFKDTMANKKILLIDILRIDCRLCDNRITDIDTLKCHLAREHQKTIFDVSNEFLKFRLTVNNLTCTECDSSFSFFHALKKHMAEHFGTCICDVCGAHYFEERMLILHQKTHQKIAESHPCKECGKIFKSKHSLFLHESKLHKREPAYQCYKCDAVLFSYSLRYRHMIDVHGEQRMFPCEHCDRAYDSRKSLREHNRRYHLKIFKHQCDLCEKRFYLPSRLKEHMATHTGERNFRCEYCGKSYPRLRGLKVHMQSHVSEKKYRCVMCNASFTQNVNLKNHIKRQHQNLDGDGFQEQVV